MAFTVSMPQPSTHALHVTSPGYYGVVDYSRNVSNFRLTDGAGRALRWEKVSKNTRVAAGNAPSIVLDYDVYGATSFAANAYLAATGPTCRHPARLSTW